MSRILFGGNEKSDENQIKHAVDIHSLKVDQLVQILDAGNLVVVQL